MQINEKDLTSLNVNSKSLIDAISIVLSKISSYGIDLVRQTSYYVAKHFVNILKTTCSIIVSLGM